jgi:hypothetical protein
MKPLKIVAIVLAIYVGLVVAFESLIGYSQPSNEGTMILTTFDDDGTAHDRVVSRLEVDGKLYVAANHWPRAWYRRVLAKPEVEATIGGTKGAYLVVPVEGAEHDLVESRHPHGFVFKLLTGFPPRRFVRLDPRPA